MPTFRLRTRRRSASGAHGRILPGCEEQARCGALRPVAGADRAPLRSAAPVLAGVDDQRRQPGFPHRRGRGLPLLHALGLPRGADAREREPGPAGAAAAGRLVCSASRAHVHRAEHAQAAQQRHCEEYGSSCPSRAQVGGTAEEAVQDLSSEDTALCASTNARRWPDRCIKISRQVLP